ncbi:MAG TPA: FAH family protein, partial [Albitalea sp.]|nr:FAH family protein [Albitalea sp.]
MLLIQFKTSDGRPRVGLIDADGTHVHPLAEAPSVRALAQIAIAEQASLAGVVERARRDAPIDYAPLAAEGRLLPPLTHPDDAHCLVTGTGLTHLGSAASRDAMHKKLAESQSLSDSMKMFQLGLQGGKPGAGE